MLGDAEHRDADRFKRLQTRMQAPHPALHVEIGRPWSDLEIRSFERNHGIDFPVEFSRFLQEIGELLCGPGNVCYPPDSGINPLSHLEFPLSEPFLGLHGNDEGATLGSTEAELSRAWNLVSKECGVLRLCSYGDSIEAVLVLNGKYNGQVWIQHEDSLYYGPFGVAEALHDDTTPDADLLAAAPREYSLWEWLDHWTESSLKKTQT